MSDFERENRYFVFKLSDAESALDSDDWSILALISDKLEKHRVARGANPDFKAVVVEEDWPEYEIVWSLIEHRVKKEVALTNEVTE